MQEALQGRGMALLVGQRLGEKGLDRLGRLGAQPGQQAPPAAIGPSTQVKNSNGGMKSARSSQEAKPVRCFTEPRGWRRAAPRSRSIRLASPRP